MSNFYKKKCVNNFSRILPEVKKNPNKTYFIYNICIIFIKDVNVIKK